MSPEVMSAGNLTADETRELGRQLRVDAVCLAERAGSGHPTSSMSAADLLAVLIANHLAFDPSHPDQLGNDHLVFSKGHATPLLYAAYLAIGLLDEEDLRGYRTLDSPLEGHPTPLVPGVPVATGSLGLGLPIGVGLGLAARHLDRTDARVWVLCGDGEMAEGSAYEAIEHAGWAGLGNLTAIVDVNRLGQTGPTRHGWDLEPYRARFDDAGWQTIVLDGHDTEAIDDALTSARESERPSAVIARTHKGSGASETDDESGKHGKPLDDPDIAVDELGGPRSLRVEPRRPEPVSPPARRQGQPLELPTWPVGESASTRDAFGETLAVLARSRSDLVALDAEVGDSTRLGRADDGDRFFQLYIAEQLMASVGIGMQVTGWRPVMATFAAFWARAADVLRMAAIGRADLCVVGSHAGVSIGEDGPSQMGLEDLALMRSLHGSVVVHPCDANQTAALLPLLVEHDGITYLRTLRGATPVVHPPGTVFAIGGSVELRSSPQDQATIVGAGVTVAEATEAADRLGDEGIDVRVVDAYSIKPIDRGTIVRAVDDTGRLVVVEDHRPEGGLGEAVLAATAGHAEGFTMRHLAVDTMPGSATADEQRRRAGIDANAIADAVHDLLRTS